MSAINTSMSKNASGSSLGSLSKNDSTNSILLNPAGSHDNLRFLEKINSETYLIGNQYQLDLISVTGIFENKIETDLNWHFSLSKLIKKVAIDTKSNPRLTQRC